MQRITRVVSIEATKDSYTWADMSPAKRAQTYQKAEQKLQEHGIVQLNECLVRWRLAQVLKEEELELLKSRM